MNLITLDFETFWSDTHTLKKLSPISYVMHDDTEIICVSAKVNKERTVVSFGETEISALFRELPFSKSLVIGHNMSEFDAMILAWRFGIRPAMFGCTLAMARPIYAKTCGLSLAALAKELKLGVKDNAALVNTKGKYLEDFSVEEIEAMRAYNTEDTELCYRLFKTLLPNYSTNELRLIDATVRMLVSPKLVLNVKTVVEASQTVHKEKVAKLKAIAEHMNVPPGVPDEFEWVRSQLASAPKFASLLESFGVPVPMKPSPTNPLKTVAALAKSDKAFLALQDHPDEKVQVAARARLGVKSVLLETRLKAMLRAFVDCRVGRMPMPLKYCGADTTGRWSGFLFNPQNMPRVDKDNRKTSDALRCSLEAPKGYVVLVVDQSGIELRVNHFLWKVPSSMAMYAKDPKADLYRAFAASNWGISFEDVTASQRFFGKVAQLGLGFGAGAKTFKHVAWLLSGGRLQLTDEEAEIGVASWRREYVEIVKGWAECHAALSHIYNNVSVPVDPWGLVSTSPDGLVLPSGRIIRYPLLEFEINSSKRKEWWYGKGRHRARIYAGKVDENIVQALARDTIADNILTIADTFGELPVLAVHDELVYVVKESFAAEFLDGVQKVMRTPPKWWPQLVTWSEGGISTTYGDAK